MEAQPQGMDGSNMGRQSHCLPPPPPSPPSSTSASRSSTLFLFHRGCRPSLRQRSCTPFPPVRPVGTNKQKRKRDKASYVSGRRGEPSPSPSWAVKPYKSERIWMDDPIPSQPIAAARSQSRSSLPQGKVEKARPLSALLRARAGPRNNPNILLQAHASGFLVSW